MTFVLQDKKADLLLNTYVDDVMVRVMKKLNLEIPEHSSDTDPTKSRGNSNIDWSVKKSDVAEVKQLYNIYCKNYKKRKLNEAQISKENKSAKVSTTLLENKFPIKEEDSVASSVEEIKQNFD